jgi:hypothetical protein
MSSGYHRYARARTHNGDNRDARQNVSVLAQRGDLTRPIPAAELAAVILDFGEIIPEPARFALLALFDVTPPADPTEETRLDAAVRRQLDAGHVPGNGGSINWKVFYKAIYTDLGIFGVRGYSERSIRRAVDRQLAKMP